MNRLFLLFALILFFVACKKDGPLSDAFPGERQTLLSGVYVLNAGDVNNAGSLTYFDKLTNTVSQNVYQIVNENPLAAGLSGGNISDNFLWFLHESENKITLADVNFLTETRILSAFDEPRHLVIENETEIYLAHGTDATGDSSFVTKIDTIGSAETVLTVKKTRNRPLQSGNILYLPNGESDGLDSTLTLINTTADTLLGDSVLLFPNPTEIVEQSAGVIWILCRGLTDTATEDAPGALILLRNRTQDFAITLPPGARNLLISNDKQFLFYISDEKVYRQPVESTNRETEVFIDRNFAIMTIDPEEGFLYAAEATEDGQPATIYRYNANDGSEISSFTGGINPVDFIFKN